MGLSCLTLTGLVLAAWCTASTAAAGPRRAPARILVLSNPSGPAAPGESVSLTAFVLGQPKARVSWSVSSATGGVATIQPQAIRSAVFQASRPGVYVVTAASGAAVRRFDLRVYGAPAAVTLTPWRHHLVADGRATDTLQVKVVDRRGVRVAGFVGNVELLDSLGQFCHASGNPGRTRVHLDGGEGTATLCAQSLPVDQTDDVETTHLEPAGYPSAVSVAGIRYGTATVHDVPATANRLALTPLWGGERRLVAKGAAGEIGLGPTYLSADRAQAVTFSLSVEDAAGHRFPGARRVTVSLTGPGSLSPTSSVTTDVLNYPAGATFTVYSQPGRPGSIRLSAASSGLRPVTYAIHAVLTTAPAHLRVLISRGFDNHGMPYNLYDVMLVDAHGRPIPGATGTIDVQDDSAALHTRNPLATRYGRAAASILYAPAADASDARAYKPGTPGAETPFPIIDGSASFAIETGAAGTIPARLQISDPANGFSVTPRYVWATGRPAMAVLSADEGTGSATCGRNACPVRVAIGQPIMVSAQVTDNHGNPLARAGLPVLFSLRPVAASAQSHFIGGSGAGEWALTNAKGVAAVKVVGSTEGAPAFILAASFDQRVVPAGVLPLDVVGAEYQPA